MKATLVSLIACILIVAPACGADTARSGTPLLIELFTSEGCSSCPPADAWLQRIDASQPVPGVEHVTYWDHDGWKDPYSRDLYTDRQSNYVRALGLSTPYTPQVIVNGKSELHLNEPQQMKQVLVEAASASRIPVSISTLNVARNGSPILRAHIEVDGEQLSRNADHCGGCSRSYGDTSCVRRKWRKTPYTCCRCSRTRQGWKARKEEDFQPGHRDQTPAKHGLASS
jgi:hypothetical protein